MANKLKLSTKDEALREILGNGKSYLVPKFQRDYSWENEQLELLWQDISYMVEQDEDFHYMGYLVIQENKNHHYTIIDGQQRLTTFTLLVLASIKRLKDLGNQEERINLLLENFIGSKDLVNLRTNNKLTLNKNNNYYYKQAVEGQELPQRGKKRTVHLMRKAIDFFHHKLKNSTGEEIGTLLQKISLNLLFTTIYIGDELNAYKVFETLNARGVQLSSSDLLKNYIFSLIDDSDDIPDEKLEDIEEKWEKIGGNIGNKNYTDYILAEWNSRYQLARKNELFKKIRGVITDKKTANDYLDRLVKNSDLYEGLNNNTSEFWKDHPQYIQIKKDLYFLKLFNIRQPCSVLMISFQKYPLDFARILRWIKIISLRYNVICREHTGEQESLYNKICSGITKDFKLPTIKEHLLKLYPTDKTFRQAFADKTMLTSQSNKKARYVLARLAEHGQHINIDETELTVEHILPLNPGEEWSNTFGDNWHLFRQRIGNMALVEKGMNKDLGQRPFPEKRKILLQSTYAINKNIDNYDEWISQTIESRQGKMADIAVNLWKI